MNDWFAPVMANDFYRRDVSGSISINKFLRRFLNSFGAKRRETQGERCCCKNDEDDNASHANVLLQGTCQLARKNYFSPGGFVKNGENI